MVFPDVNAPLASTDCPGRDARHEGGVFDLALFSDTRNLFPDPAGSLFVNTQKLYTEPWNLRYFKGPRAEFTVRFDAPFSPGTPQAPPYDPYLYVRDTNRVVRLMEVDPGYQDSNGYPFGMLLTSDWKPPLEFTDTSSAYPFFDDFVGSEGALSQSWYESPLVEFIVEIPDAQTWSW
jgi:hypothetical protein